MIKRWTEPDIECIKKACRVAGMVLSDLKAQVEPGVATIELDQRAEQLLMENGALPAFKGYRGFMHSICVSVNEEVVHGIPSRRVLKEGDILGVDVGAKVDGFFGDVAATVAVGKIEKRAARLVRATKEALFAAIKQMRAGNHLGDVSSAIEQTAKRFGYEVVRDLFGHGVGSELHEDPLIPNYGRRGEGPRLHAGMVLALEPMLNEGTHQIETLSDGWTVVTRDRKLSAHFEHSVLIGEDGPVVLTEI
jgi:methionyl aminopeptidase